HGVRESSVRRRKQDGLLPPPVALLPLSIWFEGKKDAFAPHGTKLAARTPTLLDGSARGRPPGGCPLDRDRPSDAWGSCPCHPSGPPPDAQVGARRRFPRTGGTPGERSALG